MQLTVKDLAKLLSVTERTIYRWIKEQSIPVYKIHDQYRFNRVEILDWATTQKINISHEILRDSTDTNISEFSLTEIIRRGGIHYRVEGKDKKALLTAVVNLLNLPEDVNKDILLNAMLVREELGSTGVGDGIAIPHARYPIITHIPSAVVSVCFTEEPIEFGAIDGKLVHCLFTLISPTVRNHLKTLSRIAYVLRNASVKDVIVNQGSREAILGEIEKAEQALSKIV